MIRIMRSLLVCILSFWQILAFCQKYEVTDDKMSIKAISYIDSTDSDHRYTYVDSVVIQMISDTFLLRNTFSEVTIESYTGYGNGDSIEEEEFFYEIEVIDGKKYQGILSGIMYYSEFLRLPWIRSIIKLDSTHYLLLGTRTKNCFYIKSYIIINTLQPNKYQHYTLLSGKDNPELSFAIQDSAIIINLDKNGLVENHFYLIDRGIESLIAKAYTETTHTFLIYHFIDQKRYVMENHRFYRIEFLVDP